MKNKFLIATLIIIGLIVGCDKDNFDNVESSVSGEISYDGDYFGHNMTIYIRGYISNSRAIGNPDFSTSIISPGTYTLNLGSYTGDLYLSAFMDIDNSGSSEGPSANETLFDGVYSDPSGCYGDYTFENIGPIKLNIDGAVTKINFELKDSGVIKASFSNTGGCTFGVINNHVLNETFLHHNHYEVGSTSETFLLAVPSRDNWSCKVKFDNLFTAELYPYPINVTINTITEISF